MNPARKFVTWTGVLIAILPGCSSQPTTESIDDEANRQHMEKIQRVHGVRDDWTIVRTGGDTLASVVIDSFLTDELSVRVGSEETAVNADSIAVLIQPHPRVILSTESKLMSLAGALIGGIIFWNNLPDHPNPSLSMGFVYGITFGGAMLAGAVAGIGVGYLTDSASNPPAIFDLTGESPAHKRRLIEALLAGPDSMEVSKRPPGEVAQYREP